MCDEAMRSRMKRRRSFFRALASAMRCRFSALASCAAETDDGATEKDAGSALDAAGAAGAAPTAGDTDDTDDLDADEDVVDD